MDKRRDEMIKDIEALAKTVFWAVSINCDLYEQGKIRKEKPV